MSNIPVVRSHERISLKRCPKQWYWKWRRGLVPRHARFGALELGTWMHKALGLWYGVGLKRHGSLPEIFAAIANEDIKAAAEANAPSSVLTKARELASLGIVMSSSYVTYYGDDPDINVLGTEMPLEFTVTDTDGSLVGIHRLKPDVIYTDKNDDVWLLETKTARTIRTEHLVVDEQARAYGAMAEAVLRREGIIRPEQRFRGVMYNFIRKAVPDERPTNAEGLYLNKDGSVSKVQPAPLFKRHQVPLTNRAKRQTLMRIKGEVLLITLMTKALREKRIDPRDLQKTFHYSCPKTCDFWAMCVLEEQGGDIRRMLKDLYIVQDPYAYEDTTDEPPSFEMG